MAVKLRRLSDLHTKEGKYTIVLPGPIKAELTAYIDAYRESYSDESVTPELVISAIVNQFLGSDSAFQAWKKEREGASAGRAARRSRATSDSAPASNAAASTTPNT